MPGSEALIALTVFFRHHGKIAAAANLLMFNTLLRLVQQGCAQAAAAALKSQLVLGMSICREGLWAVVPVTALVLANVVKNSLGGMVWSELS